MINVYLVRVTRSEKAATGFSQWPCEMQSLTLGFLKTWTQQIISTQSFLVLSDLWISLIQKTCGGVIWTVLIDVYDVFTNLFSPHFMDYPLNTKFPSQLPWNPDSKALKFKKWSSIHEKKYLKRYLWVDRPG